MLQTLFTTHPATVNETYGEHWRTANSFAGALFVGSLVCLVHAWLPFLFTKTGSGIITRLHDRMVTSRARVVAPVSKPLTTKSLVRNTKDLPDHLSAA